MASAINNKIKHAWLRCSINLLLEQYAWVLLAVGLTVALAATAERALALKIIYTWTIYLLGGVALLAGLTLWLLKRPTRMQTAMLIDERLALKERFSTAMALAESEDPFVLAAKQQAEQVAESVKLKRHFLIRPSRCWLYVGGAWLLVAAIATFMPALDLFGRDAQRRNDQQKQEQLDQAKDQVRQVTTRVETAVRQLADSETAADLAALGQAPTGANPEELRRQAIRKLGDLSKKIGENAERLASVQAMRKMLAQLRSTPQAPSQELYQALARGELGRAANIIRQMQEQLDQGKLSEQQRKALGEQLAHLGKQLEKLAQQNRLLEEEFERSGLDKRLAKLPPQDLRKALKKLNLTDEKIEELLRKASACKSASASCRSLGQAMGSGGLGGMGGMSADGLSELGEQLDSLEALSQELALAQASLDEIDRAICSLGQSNCQGGNCQGASCKGGNCKGGYGLYAQGSALGQGPGTGGPGRGYGPRDTAEDGTANFKGTRVDNKTAKGQVIASWYFKGPQIKTEARREFTDIVQASKDGAAEAISENQIPRKYEESIKRYFGQLVESADQ